MELSTIVGLAGALGAVLLTLIIEGGHVGSFINLSAFTLIGGGSVAVAVFSFSIKELTQVPQYIMKTIFPPNLNLRELIEMFVNLSERARREGLLSLEDDLGNIQEKMIRLGLELVVDGTDPEIVKNIMEDYSDSAKEHEKVAAEFFETMGGFSPTLGIIGTVMGLVHVLEGLGGGGGIEALGKGIAVAFIATFYGIGFANLIWLPFSNKTKYINHKLATKRAVIISGVLAIQSGDNPRVVREKLLSHITDPALRDAIAEASAQPGA